MVKNLIHKYKLFLDLSIALGEFKVQWLKNTIFIMRLFVSGTDVNTLNLDMLLLAIGSRTLEVKENNQLESAMFDPSRSIICDQVLGSKTRRLKSRKLRIRKSHAFPYGWVILQGFIWWNLIIIFR